MVKSRDAVEAAGIVDGLTAAVPASYRSPTFSSQEPVTAARVISAVADSTVTSFDVVLRAWTVAWTSYFASTAPPGHQCVASTRAELRLKAGAVWEEQATVSNAAATVAQIVRMWPALCGPFLINLCGVGHLDSQRSLPVMRPGDDGVSPMAKKLRLVTGQSVVALNADDRHLAAMRPAPVEIKTSLEPGRTYDVVILFVASTDELRRLGSVAVRATSPGGMLWIAYPKGAAADLPATPAWVRGDVLGEITAEKGYKPVAFVAVDEEWTALRFKRA